MENALVAGDYVWLDKLCYGAKLPQRFADIPLLNIFTWIDCLRESDRENQWKYIRLPGVRRPVLFDIAVFESPGHPGVWIVKRIGGLPGDTVGIRRGRLRINGKDAREPATVVYNQATQPVRFPQSSLWTTMEYGPFIVPWAGSSRIVTDKNYEWIRQVAAGEGNCLKKESSGYSCNGVPTASYRFEQNYYFMLGDNRANSLDSRYIGLIPESALIGTVSRIIFSLDTHSPFLPAVRYNRTGKRVH